MGPLWSGQGTVPHTTVSDLLSTDVLVSVSGAPVGARINQAMNANDDCIIPAVRVVVNTAFDWLLKLPTIAITLTEQETAGSRSLIV